MLEEQVHELRQRVEVSDVSPDDAGERRRVLKQTLTAAAAGESHWPETQPASMLPHPDTAYAPTQPAELAPEPAR